MVTILSASFSVPTGTEQERRTSPLTCTEQAPHCATPHPYLVPVRPTCSRITQSRGVSASACTSRILPLTLSLAINAAPPGLTGWLPYPRRGAEAIASALWVCAAPD